MEQSFNKRYVLRFLEISIVLLIVFSLLPEDKAAFLAPFQEKSISVMIVGTLLAVLMMWSSIHAGFTLGARMHMKKLEKQTSSAG